MNRYLKQIGDKKYRLRVSDEDIIKRRTMFDLGSVGDFEMTALIFEIDEDGYLMRQIVLEGIYLYRGKERKDILNVNIDGNELPDIHIDDIIEGRWTAGEIANLPWDEFQI